MTDYVECLKAAIRAQLDRLIAANETRVDLREKFESLIEAYNAGSTQIEQLFLELLGLSRALTDEEARHVRGILTVDWDKTAQSRSRVRDALEDALDAGLPRVYTPEVFKAKAGAVFQHVYERYARAA